jgi:tetratricopeptide (TPR) repeat protein
MTTNFYPLLSRAVHALEKNTPEARQSVYERARRMLDSHFSSPGLQNAADAIKAERSALEDAIWQIEFENAGHTQNQTAGPAPNKQDLNVQSRSGSRRAIISVAGTALLILVALTTWLLFPASAHLKGLLIDNLGNPVAGAEVSIANTTFKTHTDNSGHYSLEYAPGRIEMQFEKEGYQPTTLSLELATATTVPVKDIAITRRSYVDDAEEYITNRHFAAAVNSLNDAIKFFPKEAPSLLMRCKAWIGRMFEERGASDYRDQAIADCTSAIEIDPKNSNAFTTRASIWALKQDVKRQIADLDKAIELDAKNVEALSRRADLYLKDKDLDRALTKYDEVIQLNAVNWGAYLHRSIVWEVKGDSNKADADLSEAKRLSPQFIGFRDNDVIERGRLFLQFGYYEQAIADLSEAARRHPDSAIITRSQLYEAWARSSNIDRALEFFSTRIQQEPSERDAYEWRARVQLRKGDTEGALKDSDEAIRLSKKEYPLQAIRAYQLRGDCLKALGRRNEAIESYQAALNLIDPKFTNLRTPIEAALKELRAPGDKIK